MDLDPQVFFNSLNESLDNLESKECHRLLLNLSRSLTKEQLSASVIDLYLVHVFNKNHGFPSIIAKTRTVQDFKACNITLLEILYTLINNFPLKLDKYLLEIDEICLKVLKSTLTAADEKVRAMEALTISFSKIDGSIENKDHYLSVYNDLLQSYRVKKSDSVQEKILIALGTFAQKFGYLIEDGDTLRKLFFDQLEAQMIQKEVSYKMMSGIFTGLSLFCESCPLSNSSKEDKLAVGKIYKCIEKQATPSTRIKVGCRAALLFLANNLGLFVELILQKYKFWHETLLKWLELGPDDQKAGFFVIGAFYEGLGYYLKGEMDGKFEEIAMYFLEYFKKILKDKNASNYEKRLALQGICSFSPLFHLYLNQNQLKDLFLMIMQSFEQTYILNQEVDTDSLEYLPDYIKVVANLMHFKKISSCELFCLQKGVINMIKIFPELPYAYHGLVVDSLVATFYYLKSNDEKLFDRFVENTIYQGIVWTCSHQHVSEADFREVVTVKSFLGLWKKLLKITPEVKYDKINIFLHDRKSILVKIIDKLMRSLFILINKLNVSIVPAENDATDIQTAYKVAAVNDFAIFLNVVDFYQEIFSEIEPSVLRKCIGTLVKHLIEKCLQYPFISGFYKLLAFSLQICNKINYFESNDYESLLRFVEILLSKTKQFKDDLLIACLQVLLECPICVIQVMLPACVPAFTTVFYVGRSYTKLTEMAISALEKWQGQLPAQEMDKLLLEIIPLLDSYLQSKSLGGLSQNVVSNKRKTAQMLKKRKVLVEIEPELVKLQKRILNFVGKQNSSICHAFVNTNNIEVAVWGQQQHLKVTLPYDDVKLDIYLDRLVPRVITLALNSSDRGTKVAACELFQAIVMIFLGLTKQMSQSGLQDLNELLRNMALPLLKLSCDLDQVVKQLFQPLFFQLIHWYTHRNQLRSDHSAIIIEAVMEGITHPTDSALRDFSGSCVNEFVKWTIKQTPEATLAADPINIKILVKKMRFFSLHPDPFKKLGAALIFNNIYRELREESSLLNIFWIEFLHIFVKSLSSIECEEKEVISHIDNALTHIQRGFVEKQELFNKTDSNRRVPLDIRGGSLKDVAWWILINSGSKNPHCRDKCTEMFVNIAPHVAGFKNFNTFIAKNFSSSWTSELYEEFLIKYPTLGELESNDSADLQKWIQGFQIALDGYSFAIKNVSAKISDVVKNAIQYFVKNLTTATFENALALVEVKEWNFTIFEKQKFNREKSRCVLKILQLFGAMDQKEILVFCTLELWDMFLSLVFTPEKLGFDPFLSDDSLVSLLTNFLRKIPRENISEINIDSYSNFSEVDLNANVPLKLRNTVRGLTLLQKTGVEELSIQRFVAGITDQLLNKFESQVEGDEIYVEELQETTLSYCVSILNLALNDGNEFVVFIQHLFKPYKVHSLDKTLSFGSYLVELFEDSVVPKILDRFEIFANHCPYNNETVEIVTHVLNYMVHKRQLRFVTEYVCKNLVQKWQYFEECFATTGVENGIEFVKVLMPHMKLCGLKDEGIKNWTVRLLGLEEEELKGINHVDFKVEVFSVLVDVVEDCEDENLCLDLSHFKSFLGRISSDKETITIVLDKLLRSIPRMKSSELLVFLLDAYVLYSEENSVDITEFLAPYITRNDNAIQENTLLKIYGLCKSDTLNFNQKYKLMTISIPVFKYCSSCVFENFFIASIAEMMSLLQGENLIEKILSFTLIELLFLRSPIHSEDEVSPITQAVYGVNPKNRTLLLQLLKFCLDACKASSDESGESLRLYKCHAYNCIVSIITNSKNDPNFYTKLFVRLENDADILWKGLIDTEKQYVFEKVFDSIPKRRKILVNIRDEVRSKRRQQNLQSQSVKYVESESQRVFNSSLSEDVTKFDFTNSLVRTVSEDGGVQNVGDIQGEIEIDGVDVNDHECMATVCGLIEHMVRTGITPLPEEDEEEYKPPAWIKGIRALLLNKETHDNVKIFWVKVIDNTIHVFKKFARWFLEPLLKFIVDKCAGSSINYFITDVVAILASWSSEVMPKEQVEIDLASEFLIFFITNMDNERQEIFKYHLDLFKLIVESWKQIIKLPYDVLYTKLNDTTSRKVEVGVHLFSVLLANKIPPWQEDNFQNFCKKMFEIVSKNNLKFTYKPAAETIGLTLNNIQTQKYYSKVVENVHKLLKKMANVETDKCLDKYSCVLESIVLHHSPVLDEYHLSKLLSRIHAVPSTFKATYLKIILKRLEIAKDVSDFKNENWGKYVESDSLEVQLLSLEIVYKCLGFLKFSPQFKTIIATVCKLIASPNVLCRTLVFDITINICKEEDAYGEVVDFCKDVLTQGLLDNDEEIHEKVFNFWLDYSNMPLQASKRFLHILSDLYKPVTENDFLGYGTYFLLDTIKKSDDYTSELFEHPLEDCEFEDYNLQTNWRVRHHSIVPMFAETLKSYSQTFELGPLDQLRQTQTHLSFAPTQSARSQQLSQFTMSESSLFLKNEDFINPNLVSISDRYKLPKRRFLKDKAKIKQSFAHREIKKSIVKFDERKDRAKERENKVTIYRKYRTGDLPDIQITLQAFLEPLQALTLRDGEVSKVLFLSLFSSILKKTDDEYINRVSEEIKNIFNSSTQFNTNLFQALFNMILMNKAMVFDGDLITSVAQSSGLITLGILVLEEYLESYEDPPTSSKKAKGVERTPRYNYWVKLAELYKDIEEWDVVKSVFLEKLECKETIQEALLAESTKQWREAKDLYEQLLTRDDDQEKKDFYYESYFKCLANLGDWDELGKAIDHVATKPDETTWTSLWDQNWNQQKLLPWYITAEVKKTLFNSKPAENFLKDLNETIISDNSEYLFGHFSEQVGLMWLLKGETEVAKQYLNTHVNSFLNSWQLLDPLYSNLRYSKLLKLRTVVDINNFIRVFQNLNVESEKDIEGLISYWRETCDEILPSVALSETKILYRRQFTNLLEEKVKSFNDDDFKILLKKLRDVKSELGNALINAATNEGNFYMARKYIQACGNASDLSYSLGRLAYLKISLPSTNDGDRIKLAVEARNKIAPLFDNYSDKCKALSAHLLYFEILSRISRVDSSVFEEKISDVLTLTESNAVTSSGDVAEYGARKLRLFIRRCETDLSEEFMDGGGREARETKIIAESYVKLAYFAKNGGDSQFNCFMLSVLRAMRFDSAEARQLFPCLLMPQRFTEENRLVFTEETAKIPEWMFLGWIPQLLVAVDSNKVTSVAPLLRRIAKSYPQAIMYAYRLSKENYTFDDPSAKNEATDLIELLDQLLLNNEIVDKFLKALSSVSVGASVLMYYVKKLVKSIQTRPQLVVETILGEVFYGVPNSENLNSLQGNMFKKIDKYKKSFEKFRGLDANGIISGLKKIQVELAQTLQSEKERNSTLLKDYCPWLAGFSADKLNVDLEIPGQYDGKRMPLTQHHVKISGFCPNVSVMKSLRKPIRITILGNDTKEYPFLVKFGEDVRQDQRIQQLLTLMNDIFASNCSRKDLSVVTYQVVPLTTSLGMIQWVDHTTPLGEFMKKSLKDSRSLKTFNAAGDTYFKWIFKFGDVQMDAYGRAAVKYTRDQTISKFRSLVNSVQYDVLRSSFWKLSANSEGFSALRNNFIKSYATMCAVHWILGIGDRHLENTLICSKNGSALGIDFGHAFGTATQLLPVPELVPFRLTPHIVSLLEPLGERGLFREVMVHCLRALRSNSSSLLATMNVFIDEPSLDWLEYASRSQEQKDTPHEWYTTQKIDQAKRKLSGAKSTTIMIEDLKAGHKKNAAYMKAYVNLVQGVAEFDLRARMEGGELTVEDQVDALIDHATDYNLLGRMFHGWTAWI